VRVNVSWVLVGLCLSSIIACSDKAPPPPITEVVVDEVSLEPYLPNTVFVGRLQAQVDVSIQAQVSGYLKARHFHEGDLIEQGTLLYELDPAQFQASLARAKADVSKAMAATAVANNNLVRGKELAPKGAISASELDKITATKLQADADLESARAQFKSAEVDLSYTRISAPISGRIGRSDFSIGDLIAPDSGQLTSLVSIDPVNAIFKVSEAVYLMHGKNRRQREQQGEDLSPMLVKLELSNRERYGLTGRLDYVANRIDETTGTIEARAVIPNPSGDLLPGQYVKVILELPNTIDTLMLPQAAVQADQQGNFVLVVDTNNTVVRHNVVLGPRVAAKVIVEQGVDEGEQVIVRGLQKVRPGQRVTMQSVTAPMMTEQAADNKGA
jgi:membrane fusion protein (multidrug efflux system)